MTRYRVLQRNRFPRCHNRETRGESNKKETQQKRCLGTEKEKKIDAWKCMNMLGAKRNCIMGKNPIQTTSLTKYNQSHRPRIN